MTVLKSIEPVSLGKIIAIAYAIIGFIEGLFFTLIFGLLSSLSRTGGISSLPGGAALPSGLSGIFGLIGVAAVVIFPIIGAIAGFLIGAIAALVYNFVASKMGGIEVELK